MFDQCKIVIFNNVILLKKSEKCTGNFPEKYVIFQTIFSPHITVIM